MRHRDDPRYRRSLKSRSQGEADLRPSLQGLWKGLSWHAPRLRSRMSATEVVGTICGLIVTIGLAIGFAANLRDGIRAAPFLVLAVLFSLVTPVSAFQTRYRRLLCARLAVDGLETTGEVVDRWLLAVGNPSFGVLRCSFRTPDGATHKTDVYELLVEIRKYPVGRTVSVRYDAADPRACAVDCAI